MLPTTAGEQQWSDKVFIAPNAIAICCFNVERVRFPDLVCAVDTTVSPV